MQWFSPRGTVTSVFYQDSRNTLREQRAAGGQWAPGPFVVPGAAPGSGIAVVSWADGSGVHMRAYYQDAQNTIREQVYENGRWGPGAVIAAGAAPRGGIAAVQWSDASGIHLRVYYQDAQNTVREQCFDGGWQPGHQFTAPRGRPGQRPGRGALARCRRPRAPAGLLPGPAERHPRAVLRLGRLGERPVRRADPVGPGSARAVPRRGGDVHLVSIAAAP
jgi:hypothetical protein